MYSLSTNYITHGQFTLFVHVCTGKHPCPLCEMDKDHMQVALTTRGAYPERKLETKLADYRSFMAAGGVCRSAMEYGNCISEPLFDIPISHVSLCTSMKQ